MATRRLKNDGPHGVTMAKGGPEYVYWDACVVQSYIEKRPGRWPLLRDLLRASVDDAQPLKLVTSTWTVVEVAYFGALEQARQLPETYQAIRDFWDSEAIQLIEFHELTAADARDIVRRSHFEQWTIKPKDAVHAASAKDRGVREFHTYDKKFAERLTQQLGIPAGQPSSLLLRWGAPAPVEQAEQAVLALESAVDQLPAAGPSPVVPVPERPPSGSPPAAS